MSVWFIVPSARPLAEVEPILRLWRKQGYRIGLWRDPDTAEGFEECLIIRPYEGYAKAVNALAAKALEVDPQADWLVCGGDDTEPDLNHTAEEIARECSAYFVDKAWPLCWSWPAGKTLKEARADGSAHQKKQALWSSFAAKALSTFGVMQPEHCAYEWSDHTFGVMQPTGDRYAFSKHQGSAPIDRVAGSPWMGREWCLRINQGKGPLWPEYTHMFSDEELQNVASKYGVFWQRPDLIHLHHHFQRESPAIDSKAIAKPVPPHLVEANSPEHWAKYKKIFEDRKRADFPGSEPL